MALELNAQLALSDFSLDVDHAFSLSATTGVFGPSGSGKSTLLRVIAGLEAGAAGKVRFAGETWADPASGTFLPAHRRPVGIVFQDARLFPHLSVGDNLRYAVRRRRGSRVGEDFDEIVAVMNIRGLLRRDAGSLSGGERQRVALARTLLSGPRILLLDEPMASLDAGHKRELLPYLEALPARFDLPVILVSHSVSEMARLADNVVLLEHGRITATGPAEEILRRQAVATSDWSFEATSILDVRIRRQLPDLKLTEVSHGEQALLVPALGRR